VNAITIVETVSATGIQPEIEVKISRAEKRTKTPTTFT
jgi:hypothetical protein